MKNMVDEEFTQFLPFTAINNYMLSEYRHRVLVSVLENGSSLPEEIRSQINQSIRRQVKVPGFRNPAKAPPSMLAKRSVNLFEDSPEFASLILAGWAATHPQLAENMYSLLTNLKWEILPIEADRTHLPGFFPEWPAGSDFDKVNLQYREAYPDAADDSDSISLMAVWVSLRLPFDNPEDEDND